MSSIPVLWSAASLNEALRYVAREMDERFDDLLPTPDDLSARLIEAMRYAAIGGGKRLRPLLTCASADLFKVPRHRSLRAGLAVECIHVHSLIHDDLPCMDDDDLRRGKPSVHVAFDEATAVLAGDSLLALAFEVLADEETHPNGDVRAELISGLARAAGATGMAGGQMLDLADHQSSTDIEAVTRLERLKTGAVINWTVEAGALLGGASPEAHTSLRGYAQALGLAFQIADDLLDATGSEGATGKRVGKDAVQGKANFVTLLGVERARRQAEMLIEQAIEHLSLLGDHTDLLEAIARFVIERTC
ncbi:MAG TPA: farnesyl diphosphate synthase [Sphingomicrobium sp.]